MINRIDKLFKHKLIDHAQEPPARAWASVEAGLSKKNKRWLVYRIAACFLLLSAFVLAIVSTKSREVQNNSAQISKAADQQMTIAPKGKETKEKTPQPRAQHRTVGIRVAIQQKPSPVFILPDTSSRNIQQNLSSAEMFSEKKSHELTRAEMVLVTEKPQAGIVLEYTLETIETDKSKTSTVDTKGKKGLQKVIDFALDAKNSEGAVSGLRQAKDEFFAFNFRKDKQKNSK